MKISVIIPVFNAKEYIDRCIRSVLNQTYVNWEMITIDDGSTDNSLSILEKYASLDRRIIVIHQENAGAGTARNTGIRYATGEYIVFLDSDDYINSNYLSILSKHNEDVVFIDVARRDINGNLKKEERLSIFGNCNIDQIIRMQMTGKMLWGGVRKAVKNDILKKYHVQYTNHRVGEEAIYSFLLLYYTETCGFIDDCVYNYEIHDDSLSQTYCLDPWGPVAFALKDVLIDLNEYEPYADTLNAFFLTAYVVSFNQAAKIASSYDEFLNIIPRCNANIDYRYSIDFYSMSKKAIFAYILVKLKCYKLIYIVSRLFR